MCLSCVFAGITPPARFPDDPAMREIPCPVCGEVVWVAVPGVKLG